MEEQSEQEMERQAHMNTLIDICTGSIFLGLAMAALAGVLFILFISIFTVLT